jgi:hypothetical protein
MISMDILNKRSRYELGPWSHYKQGFYILSNIHRKYTGLGFYNLKDFTIVPTTTSRLIIYELTPTKSHRISI